MELEHWFLKLLDGTNTDLTFVLRQYAIDASTDFVDWFALKTNSAGRDGTFDFLDASATNYTRSFYRARLVL